MDYLYIIKLPIKLAKHSTDMLRYDGAYGIKVDEEEVEIQCTSCTLERWRSFGVVPANVLKYKVTAKEHQECRNQAAGFLRGIRFFQKWLETYPEDKFLVQS